MSVAVSGGKFEGGSTRSNRFCFLSWSPETYSLTEFVNSVPLPRVVRVTNCDDSRIKSSLVLPPDVDISQPLLLYKKYRAAKVQAKCLKASKSGKWKEVGMSVMIPDSFPGWFSLLTEEGKECAMMLTSMGQVAACRVPAFLTKFDVPVYKLTDSTESSGNKSVYVRTTMKAGSVLRLLGVWADLNGNNGSSKSYNSYSSNQDLPKRTPFRGGSLGFRGGNLLARSLSHAPQAAPQVQYVQCLSHDNEPIFIPLWATGVFYPISHRGGRNPQHIYPLSAIAKTHKLPIKARMVFGQLPNNMPEFTGTLQIEGIDNEEVIIGCTLLKDKPSLFELDVYGDLLLSQMTSEDLFTKSTGFQTALNYCKSEAENWKRQIRPCASNNSNTSSKGFSGTVSSATSLLLLKKNKSLRIRSSPPPPSKLSLLFRPVSAPFVTNKDPLRRSKSFNVEIQSVSLSLTQDEEEEENKKLSTLFNFMNKKNNKEKQLSQSQILHNNNPLLHTPQQQQQQMNHLNHHHHHNHNHNHNQLSTKQSVPDVLSSYKNQHLHHHSVNNINRLLQSHNHNHNHHHQQQILSRPHGNSNNNNNNSSSNNKNMNNNNNHHPHNPDLAYGKVLDDVTEEENIYSEISDALHQMSMNFRLPRHQSASNMSSLLKGGGGSDGAFSGGTLSGTFSSSNPSNREEDIYDSVF